MIHPTSLATRRALVCLLMALLAGSAFAQNSKKSKPPRWRVDPYTKNDPKVLKKLGYESYGPFPFGQRALDEVTTDFIDEKLHYAQIRWVETEHFRLGTSLESWTVPFDPAAKAKIRAELNQLKDRGLPKVNPKTRRLDPWLRLHLFAQRLENHYAEFQQWLGVTDADFPANEDERQEFTEKYMGEGPYLGQKGKYLVLLFENSSTYDDYMRSFTGRVTSGGQMWNFKEVDSLFYSCAVTGKETEYNDDTALHGHIVFSVTHLLICGYLHYNYDIPVWIREGLAHYFERRISPRYNSFTGGEGTVTIQSRKWKWEEEVTKLRASGKFTPLGTAYAWRDFGEMKFNDHVMIWSRWEYLMAQGQPKFAEFMYAVKGRVDAATGNLQAAIVEGTRKALREAYGVTPLTLDERWAGK